MPAVIAFFRLIGKTRKFFLPSHRYTSPDAVNPTRGYGISIGFLGDRCVMVLECR